MEVQEERASVADPVLPLMLDEARRVLDHQVRAIEELDDKTEHMLTLTVSSLGGTLLLAGVVVERAGAGARATFTAIAVGAVFHLLAAGFLLNGYLGVGRKTEIAVGADVAWIAGKANDPSWTEERHLVSLLMTYPHFAARNTRRMRDSNRARATALAFLGVGVVVECAAFIYSFVP